MTKKTSTDEPSYEFNSYYDYTKDVSSNGIWIDIFNEYTVEEIINMIKDPMNNNEALRHLSRKLYSSNGITRNTIDYMVSMPTLDYIITTKNQTKGSKIKKELFRYVLEIVKHKEFVRDAILKGAIDGVAFYYLDTGDRPLSKKKFLSWFEAESVSEINSAKNKFASVNASIISLPTDYCRIVGMKNNRYILAFDLKYFDSGTEKAESKLKKYPKEIRDGYNLYHKGEGKQMLILDNTKTIVHKISSNKDEPWGRPLVLAAIVDILYSDYFVNTKRNVLDGINNQVIYETFPQGKEVGTSALTTEQQKNQHDKVKSAITHKNNKGGISFFSVAAGTKIDSLTVDTDIFDDKNETNLTTRIGTALGFAASLLSASGTTSFSAQQTNLELVTSQLFQWIDCIVNELNKVINYNILLDDYIDIKVNYLPITHINKKSMIGYVKDLYLQGKGSLSLWASAVGISSDVFFAMLDEELEAGIEEKYPVHKTSFTQSSKDSNVGRPTVDDPTNPNTVVSKTNNSNNIPRPD